MKFEGGAALFAISVFIFITLIFFPEIQYFGELSELYRTYAIFLTICLLIFPLEQFIKEGNTGFFKGNVLVVTSIIYWSLLDLLQGRYNMEDVQIISVKYAFITLAFYTGVVVISSNYRLKIPSQLDSAIKTNLDPKLLYKIIGICFALGIFYFYYSTGYNFDYMISSLSKSRFRSPWSRGISGGFDSFLEHLKYFGYVLPALTALLIISEKKVNFRTISALAMMIFFSAFEFQGGGRRITGFLLGSFVMTFLIYYRQSLKIRHYVLLGVFGFLFLILLDMQLAFRNKGYQDMFSTYEIEQMDEIRVDDNFLRLAQVIELIPSQFPHSGMDYLIWSFARPIPRAIWPGKPMGPGFDVAEMVGAKGVSLTTTVVGEAYASFGFLMIIVVGCISGILSGTLNTLLKRPIGVLGVAFYALGVLALVAGVRALVDLIIFSYAFLGLFVVYKYLLRRKRGVFEVEEGIF